MFAARYAGAQRVSRTEEKAAGGLRGSADAEREEERDHDAEDASSFASGSHERGCMPDEMSARQLRELAEEGCVADETMRTRLIGDIILLLRDTSTPETARVAGLTFVGWLARRRLAELPHAAGVSEARESERRIRASRAKAR
jgi:hypothetical protein